MFLQEEKQYHRLFLAGIVNGIGDRFSSVAVLAMLLHLTGAGWAVGNTLAIRLIPALFFGPLGGWLADRFSKKTILVTTDLIRIGFALSFLFVHGKEDIWIVYMSSLILAAGETLYEPVRKSAIPQLVNKKLLVKVNSLEQVMTGIVLITGALIGGVVSSIFGAPIAFWLNALSFLGSAVLISTILFPENKTIDPIEEWQNKTRISIFKKVIMISVPLQLLLFCEILIASINGVDNVLISVYAVKEFHLGDVGVGLFYGVLGIGLMLSFSISNRLRKHFLMTGVVCLLLEGCFLVVLSRTALVALALLMFCCAAFMSGIGNACFDTVLMNEVPEKYQGTMFGLITTVMNTLTGISMFVSGAALQYVTPRGLGLIGGTAYMVIAVSLIVIISSKSYRKRRAS